MPTPTRADIQAIAQEHAASIGGAVFLQPSDVVLTVDSRFPGMTDAEFAAARTVCVEVVKALRSQALAAMWASA